MGERLKVVANEDLTLDAGLWEETDSATRQRTVHPPTPTMFEQVLSYLEHVADSQPDRYEGLRRGIDHCQRLSSVNDGAPWIERITDLNFPEAVQIVDWSHFPGTIARANSRPRHRPTKHFHCFLCFCLARPRAASSRDDSDFVFTATSQVLLVRTVFSAHTLAIVIDNEHPFLKWPMVSLGSTSCRLCDCITTQASALLQSETVVVGDVEPIGAPQQVVVDRS